MGIFSHNPEDLDLSYDRGICSKATEVFKGPDEPLTLRSEDLSTSHNGCFFLLLLSLSLPLRPSLSYSLIPVPSRVISDGLLSCTRYSFSPEHFTYWGNYLVATQPGGHRVRVFPRSLASVTALRHTDKSGLRHMS